MEVTTQNRAAIKALMRILMNIGLSEEAIKMTVTALKSENQMDALVNFVEKNPKASEEEIIEEVLAIAN